MPIPVLQYCFYLLLLASSGSALSSWSPLVTEGDIVVAERLTARSVATGEDSQLWAAGVIPYSIDNTLPDASIAAIEVAIARWNAVPGISLRPLNNSEALAAFSTRDAVEFVAGEFCASWVGRRGGTQKLWVSPQCSVGGVMHEIGHLVGFEHEHTRRDRDQYIQIHWENIDTSKTHNFDFAPIGAEVIGEYDYASIMHYGVLNFSNNGLPTISRLDGSNEEIGQRRRLSQGDLHAVQTLYSTDLSLTLQQDSDLDVLEIYVSNESVRGAHGVSINVPDSGLSESWNTQLLNDNWTCASASVETVTCTIDRLPGGAVERLSLPLTQDQSTHYIEVSLSSLTPDLDPGNNVSRIVMDTATDEPMQDPPQQVVSAVALAASVDSKLPIQNDGDAQVVTGAIDGLFISMVGLFLVLFNRKAGSWVNDRRVLGFPSKVGQVGVCAGSTCNFSSLSVAVRIA